MKLKLLYLIIFAPVFCFSQLDSLKGKIKSIKQKVIYTDNFAVNDLLLNRQYNYDQYGLTHESIFADFRSDLFPNLSTGYEKEFDVKGYLIKFIRKDYNDRNSISSFYSYDEEGYIIQNKDVYSNLDYEITNYRYGILKDSKNHLLAEITYKSEPENFEIKQYYYTKDKKANLIEIRNLSGFIYSDTKTNYNYDSLSRLVSETDSRIEKIYKKDSSGQEYIADSLDEYYQTKYVYYQDGTLSQKINGCKPYLVLAACVKTHFEYDEYKRIKRKIYHLHDTLFSRREYHYDHNNNLNKIEWYFKEEPCPKNFVEYSYDNKVLTKAIFTDGVKTTVYEFKYKLDSHNNWIEQIKIVDNKPFYIRKRQIIYW